MELEMVQAMAGAGSSLIFIGSNVPMLVKAVTTRDLQSYSLGQIGLANLGNLLYWLYVVGLPLGPIWFLHGFNMLVAMVMLGLYWRFEWRKRTTNFSKQRIRLLWQFALLAKSEQKLSSF
jgi:hypothetical protein